MANNKKQHTVQKAYLEQWNEGGNFFVYDLKNNQFHDKNAPKTVFRENNAYTWNDSSGKEIITIDIDEILREYEAVALPIIKKIAISPINKNERYIIANYIALQNLRTPRERESQNNFILASIKNNLIKNLNDPQKKKILLESMPKEAHDLIKELAKDPEKKVNDLFNNKLTFEIKNIKKMWLKNMLILFEGLTINNFNATWYILTAGDNETFITSDNPVVTISSSLKQKAKKEDISFSETTFPLSPKKILLIRKNQKDYLANGVFVKEVVESQESIRELNWRTAVFSDRYIVSSLKKNLQEIARLSYDDWKEIRNNKMREDVYSQGNIYVYEKKGRRSINPIHRNLPNSKQC